MGGGLAGGHHYFRMGHFVQGFGKGWISRAGQSKGANVQRPGGIVGRRHIFDRGMVFLDELIVRMLFWNRRQYWFLLVDGNACAHVCTKVYTSMIGKKNK